MFPIAIRTLAPEVRLDLAACGRELLQRFGSAEHPDLLRAATGMAGQLDPTLHQQCRMPEPLDGCFVLRGLDIDDEALGGTPAHWSQADPERSAGIDVSLLLLSSLIGQVFTWAGQQDGRVVHNVVPSRGHEQEQTGASSTVVLSLHTEDAFHPQRAHAVLLACVRNPDAVPTSVASIRRVRLSECDVGELRRPAVPIVPDAAYSTVGAGGTDAGGPEGRHAPQPVKTCWSTADGPALRFDPAYTPLHDAPPAYQSAYRHLSDGLDAVTSPVCLEPGDVLVLDNDVAVHGRVPFRPHYDGSDRWLKRVSISIPGRPRPADEAEEHGYGQRVIHPYH